VGAEAGEVMKDQKTMTVAELKKKLEEYPNEILVYATWEGVYAYIDPANFFIEDDCLVMDVEGY